MPGSSSRQPLVTSVAIKRPLTAGFRALLLFVILLAIAAAAVAWHSEQQHRRAKRSVHGLDSQVAEVRKALAESRLREESLSAQLKQQQETLDRLQASGPELRQRWLADRVNAAVSIAEQALALNQNVTAAQQALVAADRLLAEQPEAALLPLRRALQLDIGPLSVNEHPDVRGIYRRLPALDRRLSGLELPREAGQRLPAPAGRPAQADSLWEAGLAKFRSLIVIRQYDQPLQPLMDDTRRQLVRDQLGLMINQAELALLRGEDVLFRAAVEALSLRLQQDFANLPNAPLAPLLNELAALQAMRVQVSLPALASRAALDALPQSAGGAL
ncbi:MAG: uroporphyrinogen-III C-methyltransferase [Perlucidibaca sp.]